MLLRLLVLCQRFFSCTVIGDIVVAVVAVVPNVVDVVGVLVVF